MQFDLWTVGQAIGASAVSGGFGLLMLRKFMKGWVADGAQIETVNLLREEVRRLGEVNTQLAEEVNRLQLQNVKLQREIASLHGQLSEFKAFREGRAAGETGLPEVPTQ
jgi:FtsZ-binding cell division protein ZapB